MKRNFLRSRPNKLRKTVEGKVIPYQGCEHCCQWGFWASIYEEKSIPKDVPKGHLVVYVGDNCERFVIKITLLEHPVFRALLDQAQDKYDFSADSKLCIPCDEKIFLEILGCASSPQEWRTCLCLQGICNSWKN